MKSIRVTFAGLVALVGLIVLATPSGATTYNTVYPPDFGAGGATTTTAAKKSSTSTPTSPTIQSPFTTEGDINLNSPSLSIPTSPSSSIATKKNGESAITILFFGAVALMTAALAFHLMRTSPLHGLQMQSSRRSRTISFANSAPTAASPYTSAPPQQSATGGSGQQKSVVVITDRFANQGVVPGMRGTILEVHPNRTCTVRVVDENSGYVLDLPGVTPNDIRPDR